MSPLRLLLVTPPMVQLNTPYPATAYLAGFLAQHTEALNLVVTQQDPALTLFLRLFSQAGLRRIMAALDDQTQRAARAVADGKAKGTKVPAAVMNLLDQRERYLATVDAAVRFLQGRDPSLAYRICARTFLPEGPRFAASLGGDADETLMWSFGDLGMLDKAKHLASLFIDDLADAIRDGLDSRFELARYAERLAAAAPSFAPLAAALRGAPTLVDQFLDEITAELAASYQPDVLAISVPFPGNFYGGLRIAQAIKRQLPSVKVVLGGGYVNTELRELTEPALFDYVDFVTLDAGEAPLLAILRRLRDGGGPLLRTFVRTAAGGNARVELCTDPGLTDVAFDKIGTPTYRGLPLADYVSLVEMRNPVNRLWSDGRWNKLTVAHGCYWRKCTFCDISLDYIARYEQAPTEALVARIEAMIAETGQTGFHFVDEAAPPGALKALAEAIIARGLAISWWGNVRFEKTFTPELCQLLARSGCIAISGGLEAASDRLLALMQKGVTVAQVAKVTKAFADAGIMVHAYLMYGFPTQTTQETIDSLERVRQLFAAGCIHSGFWHRFAATVHSPVGKHPDRFQISLGRRQDQGRSGRFANNDIDFVDNTGTNHELLGEGLRKALYNFMQGGGLDQDVRSWFPKQQKWPKPQVDPHLIERALTA